MPFLVSMPNVTPPHAMRLDVGESAQAEWAGVGLRRRAAWLARVRSLLAAEGEALALASSQSRGRPTAEALVAEVNPLAEACRFLESNLPRLLASRKLGRRGLPLWLAGVDSEVRREPHGIVLVIGPSNYPLFLPGVQALQALAAGNAVWWKPGAGGKAAAESFVNLLVRAGLDSRLAQVLPDSAAAGQAAIERRPDKIVFTGSAATGQSILQEAARRFIPATVELSGSDAAIVCGDADLDLAARALAFGLDLNGGMTCMAPKRVFVRRSRAVELAERLRILLAGFGSTHPSLLAETSRFWKGCIDDAANLGAKKITGGWTPDGRIVPPVVLADVPACARILHEDLFGGILSLVPVDSDAEAVAAANSSEFALGASVFSREERRARALAGQINAGLVAINDLIVPTADPRIPFGGRGRSGFGVTRGAEGLLEMTRIKVVQVNRSHRRPAFAPAQPGDQSLFAAFLRLSHARGMGRLRALPELFKALKRRKKS